MTNQAEIHTRQELREKLLRWSSIYWAARAPFVFKALPVSKDGLVLDLGCNNGSWSRHLARKGAQVVGADLDETTLEQALQYPNSRLFTWPAYVNASAERLPFPSNAFSALICLDVLDIVPDDGLAASELHRILRPGGILVITVLSRERRHTFKKIAFQEHRRNYTRPELADVLQESGFIIQSDFTFYRRLGGMAREIGAWLDEQGAGKIVGLNFLMSLSLATLTRLDPLLPQSAADGGFGLVARKP